MWGLPWIIQGAQCLHKGPYEGRQQSQRGRCNDGSRGERDTNAGRKGVHEPRNAGSLWKPEMDSPQHLQEERSPANTWLLAQQDPLWISDLQKWSDNKPALFEVQVHKYSTTWDSGLPEMCHFENR